MKRIPTALLYLCAVSAATADGRDASEQSQLLLASCTGCHAPGLSIQGAPPQIFGLSAAQTVALLRRFKLNDPEATVMNRIARGYTDDELMMLAEALERAKP